MDVSKNTIAIGLLRPGEQVPLEHAESQLTPRDATHELPCATDPPMRVISLCLSAEARTYTT